MTICQAVRTAFRLQDKWVGKRIGYDLNAIRASICSEMQFNHQMPARCTAACKSETHGDAIMLGKIRKILAPTESFYF